MELVIDLTKEDPVTYLCDPDHHDEDDIPPWSEDDITHHWTRARVGRARWLHVRGVGLESDAISDIYDRRYANLHMLRLMSPYVFLHNAASRWKYREASAEALVDVLTSVPLVFPAPRAPSVRA